MAKGRKLDPIISEFETAEQAASYDRWFRKRVQAAIDDPRPSVPHDEVMQRIEATIEAAAARRGDVPPASVYDPITSEFESAEAEARYEKWLLARVAASLDDPRPSVPHSEVVAGAEAIIARAEARAKKRA